MSTRHITIEHSDDNGVWKTTHDTCPDKGTAAEARRRHITHKREYAAPGRWWMDGDTYIEVNTMYGERGEQDLTYTTYITWTDDEGEP